MKVGVWWKKRGEVFSHKRTNPIKIIPEYIEDDNRVIKRQQIIHSHDTFVKFKNQKFSKNYLKSLFDDLFMKTDKNKLMNPN